MKRKYHFRLLEIIFITSTAELKIHPMHMMRVTENRYKLVIVVVVVVVVNVVNFSS